jgi:hypothetical protein
MVEHIMHSGRGGKAGGEEDEEEGKVEEAQEGG